MVTTNFLKVGNTDFSYLVQSLKIGYETLVSDESGRNANGDTVFDIVNRKYKIYITLRPTTENEMYLFLQAIKDYVIQVSAADPKTKTVVTNITCYTGTPEPEYYSLSSGVDHIFKPMSINFIEM